MVTSVGEKMCLPLLETADGGQRNKSLMLSSCFSLRGMPGAANAVTNMPYSFPTSSLHVLLYFFSTRVYTPSACLHVSASTAAFICGYSEYVLCAFEHLSRLEVLRGPLEMHTST